MSTDSTYVGKKARNLNISPAFQPYAGVFVYTDEDKPNEGFAAGDTSGATGRVLEVFNPWATQEIADNIFNAISGWQYQPYEAQEASLDPAAELGDGVTINNEYSGIYSVDIDFSHSLTADLQAPQAEDLTHEYGYKTQANRQYTRKMAHISATLLLNAEQIDARVTKTSPEGQTSFGWNLTDTEWRIYNGNKTILRASASGLEVFGRIEAESGHIGGSDGFIITSNAIYKNLSRFGGTQTTGVYIGTDGIQLGQNFKVDSSGNLIAASGRFTGTVYAGNIQYGGAAGTLDGYGLTQGTVTGGSSGAIGSGTVSTANTAAGINTTLGYADFSNSVFNGWTMATAVWASSFRVGYTGTQYVPMTLSFYDQLGNLRTIHYLGTY